MIRLNPRRLRVAAFGACALSIALCFALPFGVFAAWDAALEHKVHTRATAAPQLSVEGCNCPLALALYTQVQQHGATFPAYETDAQTTAQLPAAVLREIELLEQANLLAKNRIAFAGQSQISVSSLGALTGYLLSDLQLQTESETGKIVQLSWSQPHKGSLSPDALADAYLGYLGLADIADWESFSVPLHYEGTENAMRYQADLQLYLSISIGESLEGSEAHYRISLSSIAPQQARASQ